jgi:hypothetical protein
VRHVRKISNAHIFEPIVAQMATQSILRMWRCSFRTGPTPEIEKTGLTDLYDIQTESWAPMLPRPPRPEGAPARDGGPKAR